MKQKLIDKNALAEKIIKRLLPVIRDKHYDEWEEGQDSERIAILEIINTLEVIEVDLEEEVRNYIEANFTSVEEPDDYITTVMQLDDMIEFAKHFFERGMAVNNPVTAADRGTAEEIIFNLKRVEQDHLISLTKEIEWVRNQVKKGE